MPVGECPHARRQEDAAKPIGCADANRPDDRLSFAARRRLRENVGALDRLGAGKKPFARVGQSVAAITPVEETAVQILFKRLNVARHRRVFRAELLGRGRQRPRPSNCEKVSKIVPILAWLFVSHRPLLISTSIRNMLPLIDQNAIADRADVDDGAGVIDATYRSMSALESSSHITNVMRFPSDEVFLRRGGAINAHRLGIYRRSLGQIRSYIPRQPTSLGLLGGSDDVSVLCQQPKGKPP